MDCCRRETASEQISSCSVPLVLLHSEFTCLGDSVTGLGLHGFPPADKVGALVSKPTTPAKTIPLENLYSLIERSRVGCWAGKINNNQINRNKIKPRMLLYQYEQTTRLSTFIPQLLTGCRRIVRHCSQ